MLKVNEARLLETVHDLSQIGGTADGGVSRPAMSPADVQARTWFRARVEEAGLQFRQDGAGNLSAVLPSENAAAPTLLAGSHLDTVPNGGRFDGALGVLSALEALRTIKEANLKLPVHLEAISFTDEEGSILGLLGSHALSGQLTPQDLAQARGGPEALQAGLERLGITRQSILSAARHPEKLLAFVELHIEQGTRLQEAGIDIGVVTAIVGIRSYWLRFQGVAAHAGTMPMARRADALWGAAAFVQQARDRVTRRFAPGVMNCGQLQLQPGAFNIVPARAQLALEFRHGTEAQLDEMEGALLELAQAAAQENGLALETVTTGSCRPAPLDETVMAAIETAAAKLDLSHTRLMSFAGHDTQAMSAFIPSAMLFVPSIDGVSHSPHEFTRQSDVVNGANVLLHTLLQLAQAADRRRPPGPGGSPQAK